MVDNSPVPSLGCGRKIAPVHPDLVDPQRASGTADTVLVLLVVVVDASLYERTVSAQASVPVPEHEHAQ